MKMPKQLGNLEEEAIKRKERLKNLKRKFEEHKIDEIGNVEREREKIEIPKPIFRNYRKEEDNPNIIDDVKITEITELPGVKQQLDEMKSPLEITDIDVTNLAPRKVDFDLKRSIAKKLQKLEKRTQKAISELIRQRLNNQDDNNFAMNVNLGAQETQNASSKDVDSD